MTLAIARGVIAIARADYEATLGGAAAVVVLRRGAALWLIPVLRADAGGTIVKIRNAAGDRAIDARELLRGEGIADDDARELTCAWCAEHAALVAEGAFA